jgi:hypothetical protein
MDPTSRVWFHALEEITMSHSTDRPSALPPDARMIYRHP